MILGTLYVLQRAPALLKDMEYEVVKELMLVFSEVWGEEKAPGLDGIGRYLRLQEKLAKCLW